MSGRGEGLRPFASDGVEIRFCNNRRSVEGYLRFQRVVRGTVRRRWRHGEGHDIEKRSGRRNGRLRPPSPRILLPSLLFAEPPTSFSTLVALVRGSVCCRSRLFFVPLQLLERIWTRELDLDLEAGIDDGIETCRGRRGRGRRCGGCWSRAKRGGGGL